MPWNLPDWILDRLEFDNNLDLQQHPLAEVIYNGDRPYYNVRRVAAEIEGEFDKDTVRSRLNEMVEQGVLKAETINRGDIYWIDRTESDWPIPPDVEVEPKETGPTVSEFFGRGHVKAASVGVLGATMSGLIMWVGTLQASGILSLPWGSTKVLALGLTVVFLSYLMILLSVVVWTLEKGTGEYGTSEILSNRFDRE